jgi:hypothetical protein
VGSTLEEIRKVKDSLESERDMFIIKIPQMVLNLKLGFNGEGEDITPVVEDFSLDFEDTGGFKPKDEKTKEERSLDNRKKVYPLNYEQTLFLDDAEIEGCNYSDFSWDTFLYFLYWRTCLRNNIITKTPSVFMSSYIADICILVECDTPQIAY